MSTPAIESNVGVVDEGAFRTYLVDSTLLPETLGQLRRGSVLRLIGNLTVNKCDASNRDPVAIASQNWPDPKASAVLSNFAKSTNIGDLTYDKARVRFITGQKYGEAWVLVAIPANGNDVTITAGTKIVPSLQAGAGVAPIVAPAGPTAAEVVEERRVIGTALTNIHTELDAISGLPSLGLNTVDTLVKSVTVEVLGWVLVKLDIR